MPANGPPKRKNASLNGNTRSNAIQAPLHNQLGSHNESTGLPGLKESNPAQYAFVERMVGVTRQVDSLPPCHR